MFFNVDDSYVSFEYTIIDKEEGKMFCTKCRNEVENDAKFCGYCGYEFIKEKEVSKVRPWIRFFARSTDYWSLFFSIGLTAAFANEIGLISLNSYNSILNMNEFLLQMLGIFIWIFIEPIFLSTWGTTPGKWLFKTTVRTLDGSKLTFSQAINRSASVWLRGYAIGIPFISFITLLIAYDNITKNSSASWDQGNFVVLHERIGAARTALIILFYIAFIWLMISENM